MSKRSRNKFRLLARLDRFQKRLIETKSALAHCANEATAGLRYDLKKCDVWPKPNDALLQLKLLTYKFRLMIVDLYPWLNQYSRKIVRHPLLNRQEIAKNTIFKQQ